MLTPAERIDVIKEIAARLSREGWSLIDLTLTQFGLPTRNSWEGDESSYITRMIPDAPGETLVQLASHLGYYIGDERPAVEPDFWETGHFRLFASHVSEHKDYVTKLQSHLRRFNISTFVAHKDISPTREWEDEIKLALNTADALVALLTPGFHKSRWTDQEVGFVLGRGLLAVAINLGEQPYGFMSRIQAFQGEGKPKEKLAREVFDAFLRNKQTKRRMTHAIVGQFEHSGNFDSARRNVQLLEGIDYWEPSFEERINRALDQNSQIQGSWGVPDQARRLIQKWNDRDYR